MTAKTLAQAISCVDDYDPNALPVAYARNIIADCIKPVTAIERVTVRAALGRILAEDVVSGVNVPAHDNSAMDGYALRHADLRADGPTVLREIGTAFAGHPFTGNLVSGACVRIMTGAVMPPGADTVVVQEAVKADGDRITIPAGQEAGQNRRRAGEDVKSGATVLRRGHAVRPAELGLLASLGATEASVYRPLRVAFFPPATN